jgi:hypothetical protein
VHAAVHQVRKVFSATQVGLCGSGRTDIGARIQGVRSGTSVRRPAVIVTGCAVAAKRAFQSWSSASATARINGDIAANKVITIRGIAMARWVQSDMGPWKRRRCAPPGLAAGVGHARRVGSSG